MTEHTRSKTPWERFREIARKVVQTPKTEVEKRERAWRDEKSKRRPRSSSGG